MAASKTKITPPFSWLGAYAAPASLVMVLLLAAVFRFMHLATLPPGLSAGVATSALQSLGLIKDGHLPGFEATAGYAPLWVCLQALPIKLFGATELAVRLWPALLGTLAALFMWLWLRSWFGIRIAWMGSLLLAVSPWAVTLSRNGSEVAAMPLLVTSLLWLITKAWRNGRIGWYLAVAGTVLAGLLLGPLGWTTVGATGLLSLAHLYGERKSFTLSRPRMVGLGAMAAGLAVAGYVAGMSLEPLKLLPTIAGTTLNPVELFQNLVRTLLMFNVPGAGDASYLHNVAGQPLLNVFVGLMLVAGLLVSISRLHARRYRWLLALAGLLLVPAIVTTTGSPNAGRAAAAMPLVIAIATIGISYMLELWYATFPINSAARTMGQSAILVLLGLTVFQGYTQYFRAWAGSGDVYAAYNEGSVRIAANMKTDKPAGTRYLVATPHQQAVVAYLGQGAPAYTPLTAAAITALPITPGAHQFYITADQRLEAVNVLKPKFPGGVLRPHYSLFNQIEIYYTYEVTK